MARDGPNAQPAGGRMLDVEACLAVCTDEVSDGSQRISGDRQAFTGKVPQGADQMYAASNAFQKDKAQES